MGPGGSPRAPEVPQWAPEAPQVAYVWHLRALRAPKCHTYLGAFPALRLPRPPGPSALATVCPINHLGGRRQRRSLKIYRLEPSDHHYRHEHMGWGMRGRRTTRNAEC